MVGTRRRQQLLTAIIGDPAREERADRAAWAANAFWWRRPCVPTTRAARC
jgi:hypothetical protein